MALVHVRNRETGEELHIGQEHLDRWPEDPYDVIDDTAPAAQPQPKPASSAIASATRDDDHDF